MLQLNKSARFDDVGIPPLRPISKGLEIGDRITLRYKGYEETLRLIHRPLGAGDLWQFVDEDGAVIAVNPYYSELREMVRKV